MGSLVPPPSGDHFTSELCVFLSALATTSGTQFDSLSNQMVKLRDVLLEEVVRDSDTENDTSVEETDAETVEETLSESSTEKESEDETSDICVKEMSKPVAREELKTPNNRRVMLSLQRGARYELEERLVKQAFSKYGKIIRMKLYEKPYAGAWGFIEFRFSLSVQEALNQVVRTGNCWLHTSLPMYCLTEFPVPHQILLESRYLPQVWEKEIVLRSFFSKFGIVTGVTLLGFKQFGVQRFVISFKDSTVAQELIGTTVKILTCTVVVKEVSSSTVTGEKTDRSGFGEFVRGGEVLMSGMPE